MSSKKLTNAQLKKFRSDVAKLKAKGLVSAKVDARKQAPTKYMKSQVKKFTDVLEGKAKVAHVPKRADAKAFAEKFRVKGKSVIIPAKPDEHIAYSKKNKAFSATRRTKSGKKITREIYSQSPSKSRPPSNAKNVLYVIPLGNNGEQRQSFDSWEDLVLFMEPYETKKNPYKDWEEHVEIVRYESDDDA